MKNYCGIIYKVTNLINGKVYIGQTTSNFKKYIRGHINSAIKNRDNNTKHFYRAIRKYGPENFSWEIIDEADLGVNIETLNLKEIYWIRYYKSYGENDLYDDKFGYNMTKGGESTLGYVHSKSSLLKGTLKRIETFKNNPKIVEGIVSNRNLTLKKDPSIMKGAMNKRKIHYENNPGKKEKEILKMKATVNTPECKKRKSKNKTQFYIDHPEVKTKLSESSIKKYEDHPEIKDKISAGVKKYFEDNPDAGKLRTATFLNTLKENPEISKNAAIKRKNTMNETKIMKEVGKRHSMDALIRKDIKQRCLSIIEEYNISDITLPSNRAISQKWKDFEIYLMNLVEKLYKIS